MSILKKFLKAIKKVFSRSPRKKKKIIKKKSISTRKKRSVSKARKKPVKVLVVSRRQKSPAAPLKKKIPIVPKAEISGLRAGEVTHYFDRIKVCVIRVDQGVIKKGDRLLIKGKKSQLLQKVVSMQIENEDVSSAHKGQMIGLKVTKPVGVGDEVFQKK